MTEMIVRMAVQFSDPHNNVTIQRSRHLPHAANVLKITFHCLGENYTHSSEDVYKDRKISIGQHFNGLKYSSSGMWCYNSWLRFLR